MNKLCHSEHERAKNLRKGVMPMAYKIISDGSCDLKKKFIKESDIEVVPFYVSFSDGKYLKEGEDIEVRDFYDRMVADPKEVPKSSLPTVKDYVDSFTKCAESGTDVICICITTSFSGSYNAAMSAADIVNEKYPDINITIIDSMMDTVLQGLYVKEAAKLARADVPYEEAVERLLSIREYGRIFFTIGSMDYLVRGGRAGKVFSAATGVLKVRPLIELRNGDIYPFGVARSRHKSMKKTIDKCIAYFKKTGYHVDDYSFTIGYGYDKKEAYEYRNELQNALMSLPSRKVPEIGLEQIGAVIGTHTGPYPIGVAFVRRADVKVQDMAADTKKSRIRKNYKAYRTGYQPV